MRGLPRRPGRWLGERVRYTLRIARWEVTKNAGGVDRRTVLIAALAMVGLGAITPFAVAHGVAFDDGIYRVGVTPESPYYEPVAADPTFAVREPSREAVRAGEQELLVRGAQVRAYARTPKGRAALSELRNTVKRYNDGVMLDEPNRSAAFPVEVNLSYRDQPVTRVVDPQAAGSGPDAGDGGTGDGTTGGDGSDGGAGTAGGDGGATDGGAGTSDGGDGDGTAGDGTGGGDGGAGDGTGGDGTSGGETAAGGSGGGSGGSGGGGGLDIASRLTGGGASGTPSDIAPPFPFRSLVLAFVYVLPLNFIIQAYGSSVLSERINRRGELLLVSPVTRGDIIVGKTAPYFAGAVAIASLITLGLQGSAVSVLAVMPLAMLYLAATFLGAMFARSFKELTFVTVTVTVSLTSFAFVPAIFTDVVPIALISPLTLVVRDLQGQAIGLGEFAFSTVPSTLTALVLFGLGTGLYREEDMFTQRPIPLKVLDSLAGRVKSRWSAAKLSALLMPFVVVAELAAIALLFALQEISIPLVLVVVAVVEEVAKSLHVYAGYEHARFDRRLRTAVGVGALSGLGFFAAEKFALIARLVNLPELAIGRAALNTGLVPTDPGVGGVLLLLALLLAPLALHSTTAAISAVGASRGKRPYFAALAVAIAVHLAYNLTVVSVLVG